MSRPYHIPALARISSIDGVAIGWWINNSLASAIELKNIGIVGINCSSGGMKMLRDRSMVRRTSGIKVASAERMLSEGNGLSIAVGFICEAKYAESKLRDEKSMIASFCSWSARAALSSGCDPEWAGLPDQYGRWWFKSRF